MEAYSSALHGTSRFTAACNLTNEPCMFGGNFGLGGGAAADAQAGTTEPRAGPGPPSEQTRRRRATAAARGG
jgi:hypothetical protein